MKLCIFSRAFYPSLGGLERIGHILATQAAALGHTVDVVTDASAISDADDQRLPFAITRTREYRGRAQAFRRGDAVLFLNVSLHGMLAAITARVPIVLSHHGIYRGRGFPGQPLELLKRQLTWVYPNISVSRFVARNLPAGSIVIPNAYDSDLFKQPERPSRTGDFVFCGRLVSDKGADMCVRAFSHILKNQPATLTIVGDGPERSALQALAQNLGISAQVTFAGAMNGHQLVFALQQHACLVVPSLWEEPFGIVALEGIACCDTVIVTGRGGLPEAVGECGVVVEATDSALAAAMASVVKARRGQMILPGEPPAEVRRAHLARHSAETVTRQYLAVLQRAASRRAQR